MPSSQADFDSFASSLSEAQVLELARLIAPSPSIAVYPGWHFGIAEEGPDTLTMMRLALWRQYHARQYQHPVVMDWIDGLKFAAYLNNDTSRLVFVGGGYEPNELSFLDSVLESGMVFLDIGANEGLYSLFAAHRVGPGGQVLAFEPSSREFVRLKANVELNALMNVDLFQIAFYNKNERATFHIADQEHSGQNSLGGFIYAGVKCLEDVQVTLRQLDTFAAEIEMKRIDVVKIDAEGSEFAILLGAERMLRQHMPILLLELSDQSLLQHGSNAQAVLSFLRTLGYRLFVFDEATGMPVESHNDIISSSNIVARKEA